MTAPSLFARCQSGDADARNELLKMHVGIVHFIARRLARSLADEAELDELVSAGHIGLMSALEHFEESRGLAFTTFAAARVRGAMLDELRRQDRVPRSVRAKARQLNSARAAVGNRLGRRPSQIELAAEAGMPVATLWQWQSAVDRAGQVSLDAPARAADGDVRSIGDHLACDALDPLAQLDQQRASECLREAIAELGDAERRVVSMYFFEDKTLQEIAPHLGVSESRVSQIRTRALARLRVRLADRDIATAFAA